MLKEGDKAPDIRLLNDAGEPFQLSAMKGKRVVLYSLPQAPTRPAAPWKPATSATAPSPSPRRTPW